MEVGHKFEYKGIKFNGLEVVSDPLKIKTQYYLTLKCHCGSVFNKRISQVSYYKLKGCKNCDPNFHKYWGKTQSLFDYWMSLWNPETHDPNTYKLPIFAGIIGREYIRSFCYVDKEDYPALSKIMWVKGKHYVKANLSKENCERLGLDYLGNNKDCLFVHREVLSLIKTQVGDHINYVTYDNRRKNLRVATTSQNGMNSRVFTKNKSSKYRGVWKTKSGSYLGQIMYNYKRFAKTFKTEVEAANFYDQKAKELFKEFAILNFPESQ